jgi:dimethylamine/trimethylamine dehydrogenase
MAELPDLWDINIDDYAIEMGTSRFVAEGALEPHVGTVKSMTSKPVVSVGRFTSPDTMVGQVKRGVMDLIGAARPSIADPFLPKKIEEGRQEDIRECIGCNICYTGDSRYYPTRCTQNPTFGEEWRRGWHPEKIETKVSDAMVLVVGAGPAGLEAARALGQRGYDVMLAEATRELGGRVTAESALPGLAEWARVRDYRLGQFNKLPNVETYRESEMTLANILEIGADHVAIATGATWRRDGFGLTHAAAMDPLPPPEKTFTPDDIMAGRMPEGSVLVFDDDRFYMGGVIAEKLAENGNDVTYLTPGSLASFWTYFTDEHDLVYERMTEAGVQIILNRELLSYDGTQAVTGCVYTGAPETVVVDNIVLVTSREPRDALFHELQQAVDDGVEGAPKTVQCIGDANAPAIIAAAVFAGHKYARELDCDKRPDERVKVDRVMAR